MTAVTDAGVTRITIVALLLLGGRYEDICAVQLHSAVANSLDERQVIRTLERAVFLPVFHNGLSLGLANAIQLRGDRFRICGVDIDRSCECPQWGAGDQRY
jgi:hypothetical protein